MAKGALKLREKDKTTLCSLADAWCLLRLRRSPITASAADEKSANKRGTKLSVKELLIFVTVKNLDNTLAVLSLGGSSPITDKPMSQEGGSYHISFTWHEVARQDVKLPADSPQKSKTRKKRTSIEHMETCCRLCQSGWHNLHRIL